MAATSIEWCDHSVNPIRARLKSDSTKVGHYCEKIAPGCTNCYSSAFQPRFGLPEFGAGQKRELADIFLDESKLAEVRRRRKPTRYFWCDMTDIFGDWMQPEWLKSIFETIDETPQHTHLLLTKRPQNVRKMWVQPIGAHSFGRREQLDRLTVVQREAAKQHRHYRELDNWRSNVWLLASVSDQTTYDAFAHHLWQCRDLVPVLGWSAEPLLGPISMWNDFDGSRVRNWKGCWDWLIVGGESGPHARSFNVQWARDVIAQCKAAGVPVFVKQLGARPKEWLQHGVPPCGIIDGGGYDVPLYLKDRKGGDATEWPEDLRVREFPKCNE